MRVTPPWLATRIYLLRGRMDRWNDREVVDHGLPHYMPIMVRVGNDGEAVYPNPCRIVPSWSYKGAKREGVDPGLAIVVREGGDEEVVHPDLCHSMTIMVRKQ